MYRVYHARISPDIGGTTAPVPPKRIGACGVLRSMSGFMGGEAHILRQSVMHDRLAFTNRCLQKRGP